MRLLTNDEENDWSNTALFVGCADEYAMMLLCADDTDGGERKGESGSEGRMLVFMESGRHS